MPILVAGAGPAGLTAALELARRHRPVRIIEKREHRSDHFRALSINSRTLELLEATGVSERLLKKGSPVPAACYRDEHKELFRIDYTSLVHRYNFMLALPQNETEDLLEARLRELGVEVEHGCELESFSQERDGISARVRRRGRQYSIDAAYIIGADGASSTLREAAGIPFPGAVMPHEWSLADVRMTSPWPVEPANIMLRDDGMLFVLRIRDDLFRLGSNRPGVLDRLPAEFRISEVLWQNRFAVSHRQAASYRAGRLFLIGDAAHTHAPMGARGMNMSIEDAVLLVEAMVNDALDSFSPERLRAGRAALRMIRIQTLLVTSRNPILRWLVRHLVPALLKIPAAHSYLVERMLGIGYVPQTARNSGN